MGVKTVSVAFDPFPLLVHGKKSFLAKNEIWLGKFVLCMCVHPYKILTGRPP